ncbi:probable inactive receptor kinase At4g23740 [Zingiber officinale]|uniref:probable inactive receptor kinase At4g23740 n=1 Tax=Zingiber officinale TaxID=94328 RepID=UPI001C4CF161|nr:probable inactive receptor kinase At4g23740 [Zingiber officinale]
MELPDDSFTISGIFLFFLLLLPPPAASSCSPSDLARISLAFRFVTGFQLPSPTADCTAITLPSCNLTGAISWTHLRRVSALRTIDLSGNNLLGSIPALFWSAPRLHHVNLADNRLGGSLRFDLSLPASPLKSLNLSGNRFTSAGTGLEAALPHLEVLDLSRNHLGVAPPGMGKLRRLRHLDMSHNDPDGGESAATKARLLRSASHRSHAASRRRHRISTRYRTVIAVVIPVSVVIGLCSVVLILHLIYLCHRLTEKDGKVEERGEGATAAGNGKEGGDADDGVGKDVRRRGGWIFGWKINP